MEFVQVRCEELLVLCFVAEDVVGLESRRYRLSPQRKALGLRSNIHSDGDEGEGDYADGRGKTCQTRLRGRCLCRSSLTTGSSQRKRNHCKLFNCMLLGTARRRRGSRVAKRLNAHFDLEALIVQRVFEQER